jgi:hypothetical protein
MLRTLGFLLLSLAARPVSAWAQAGRIVSEHVLVRVPVEREWVAREAIVELERRWRYINRMTGESLPRQVEITADWSASGTRSDAAEARIAVGMASAAAGRSPKTVLLHDATRELALLGLAELSRGATRRVELRFLADGMAEILVHEADHTARALGSAWPLARMLDRMRPLSLAALAAGEGRSPGVGDLRAAAPAITLLLACFERHGRDRTLKLFDALRKGSLDGAAMSALRTRAAALEEFWLAKVRAAAAAAEVTVTSGDDAPVLKPPPAGRVHPGAPLRLRIGFEDQAEDLAANSMFALDETSNRVVQGEPDGARSVRFELPIEAGRRPGVYQYRVLAVDDAGNARSLAGSYTVEP